MIVKEFRYNAITIVTNFIFQLQTTNGRQTLVTNSSKVIQRGETNFCHHYGMPAAEYIKRKI